MNGVEDTRPVLDYYKQRGGDDRILESFRITMEQMRAEEELERQTKAQSRIISPYTLRKKGLAVSADCGLQIGMLMLSPF